MKSGILLINKQENITSNQIVQLVKRKFQFHKVGHAGTLDPLATGLMVILINEATKISDYLLTSDKEYYVEMQLFYKTTTGDLDGEIIEKLPARPITEQEIINVLNKFQQLTYNQVPPIYSAIKYHGKKLYQYARQNIAVEVKSRLITINKITFHKYEEAKNIICFSVNCSKGTYIRSLVMDIAEHLKTIAVTVKLVRTKSGNFTLQQANVIEKISNSNIISLYDSLLINHQPIIKVSEELVKKISYGQKIILPDIQQKLVFLKTNTNKILGIYTLQNDGMFSCQRLIHDEEE